jgi:hypothetical protein
MAVSQLAASFCFSGSGGKAERTRSSWIVRRAARRASMSRSASSYVNRISSGPSLVSMSSAPLWPSESESTLPSPVTTTRFRFMRTR